MDTLKNRAIVILASSLILSACNKTPTDAENSANTAPTIASDWAADACKVLPAADASMKSGLAVASSALSDVSNINNIQASTCTYSTADGKSAFTIMLRHDVSGTLTSDMQMKGLTAAPDMTGPAEEVVMATGKAIWAPQMKTLSYVPDDTRTVIVSLAGQEQAPEQLKNLAANIAKSAVK